MARVADQAPEDESAQFWVHAVFPDPKLRVVARDCRFLRDEEKDGGFSLGDVAAACLGRAHREAGKYAIEWGERLSEILLDRNYLGEARILSRLAAELPKGLVEICERATAAERRLAATRGGSPWCLALDYILRFLMARATRSRAESALEAWVGGRD